MIKILVDSASDCANGGGVYDFCVPLTVSLENRSYLDGVELTSDAFYKKMTASQEFPKTSQPSPEAFAEVFAQVKEQGDELICFTLSSALSGTYQSAAIAKDMVDYDGIYLVDTLAVTHMIGILTRHAAKRIQEGASAQQIVAECLALRPRIKVLAGLATLENLYRGGRLSRTSAAVGEIAGIKPILTVTEEGTVNAAIKAIGVPRAISTIVNKLKSADLDEAFPICTLCSCDTENLTLLEQKLAAAGLTSQGRLQVGPVIGAHAGPGVYGVLYVTK